MTFEEKRVILAACVSYQKKKESEAARFLKNGDQKKSADALAEAAIAGAMVNTFAEILPMSSGSVKI